MSNTHHVCFSGSLACSGPNPCKTCFDLVNHHVIAFAMQNAGMTLEQGRVLFQWIEEGWKRLHLQMMQDPNIAQRALDTSRVRIEPLPAPMPARAPMVAPTAPFVPPSPPMAAPMAPPASPMAPMTFPMTPATPQAIAPSDDALLFDPSAPIDPRLILMVAAAMQQMQQMQQAAQEEEQGEEQEEEAVEEEQVLSPAVAYHPVLTPPHQAPPAISAPSIISFPEPVAHAEASLPPQPIADVMQKPVAALQRSNGNGVAVARSELNARTEMTVEDIMSLGSPLVDDALTSASADVEPAEPALNGAPTT